MGGSAKIGLDSMFAQMFILHETGKGTDLSTAFALTSISNRVQDSENAKLEGKFGTY